MHMCVYVCVCSSRIHRDHVKDCVSYRCKPWTSGRHISNAQKGTRGGAKPQRRAVPQSLNSGGRRGWGLGLHHYSIHLLLARLSAHKPVFFHYAFDGHPSKSTTSLKKHTSGVNLDRNGSSAVKGEYQFTDLDVRCIALFSWKKASLPPRVCWLVSQQEWHKIKLGWRMGLGSE